MAIDEAAQVRPRGVARERVPATDHLGQVEPSAYLVHLVQQLEPLHLRARVDEMAPAELAQAVRLPLPLDYPFLYERAPGLPGRRADRRPRSQPRLPGCAGPGRPRRR